MIALSIERIQRVMVLVDIAGWELQAQKCAVLVQDCVEKLVQACEHSFQSCLWSFKLFDSSLSSLRSRSKIEDLVGSWAIQVPFESFRGSPINGPTSFAKFGSALKCLALSLLQPTCRYIKHGGGARRVEFVVRCLQELLTDYIWDPLLLSEGLSSREEAGMVNDFGSDAPLSNINLVILFSSFPSTRKNLLDFLNDKESVLHTVPDAEIYAQLSTHFSFVRESFVARSIHLCWVDVPDIIFSVGACRDLSSVIGEVEIRTAFENLNWSFTSLDVLLICFRLMPISVVWHTFAHLTAPLFNRSIAVSAEVYVYFTDRNGTQAKYHLCKIEAVSLSNSSSDLCKSEYQVQTVVPKSQIDNYLKVTSKKAFLCRQRVEKNSADARAGGLMDHQGQRVETFDFSESKLDRGQIVDRDWVGDHIFTQLQQNAGGEFQIGKPAWQLFLLHLEREQSLAVVEVHQRDYSFIAILEPFTAHLAILTIVEERSKFVDFLTSYSADVGSSMLADHGWDDALTVHENDVHRKAMLGSGFDKTHEFSMTGGTDGVKSKEDLQNCIVGDRSNSVLHPFKKSKAAGLHMQGLASSVKLKNSSHELSKRVSCLRTRHMKSTGPPKLGRENGWQTLWASILYALNLKDAVQPSFVKLEDRYLKMGECSKSLRILKCWMKQTRQKSQGVLSSLLCKYSFGAMDLPSQQPSWVGNSFIADENSVSPWETATDVAEPTDKTFLCLKSSILPAVALDEKPDFSPQIALDHASLSVASVPVCASGHALDEKPDFSSQVTLDHASLYVRQVNEKIDNCLSSTEIDIHSFAERVVRDSKTALSVILESKYFQCGSRPKDSNSCSEYSIVEQLIELLLQCPKKLAAKYRKCRLPSLPTLPAESDVNADSYLYSSEEKVREYELQIKFRLEILTLDVDGIKQKKLRDVLVNEVCKLLENIQFNLPGGIFEGESLLDFSNRVIRSRYKDNLPDIVNEIYTIMEFDGHNESTETLFPSETVMDGKGEPLLLGDANLAGSRRTVNNPHYSHGTEDDLSYSDNTYSSSLGKLPKKYTAMSWDAPCLSNIVVEDGSKSVHSGYSSAEKLKEAQKKRERAKRFSHFASADVLRFKMIKQLCSGSKKQLKGRIRPSSSKVMKSACNEVVLATPMAGEKVRLENSSNAVDKMLSTMVGPISEVMLSETNIGHPIKSHRQDDQMAISSGLKQNMSVKRQLIAGPALESLKYLDENCNMDKPFCLNGKIMPPGIAQKLQVNSEIMDSDVQFTIPFRNTDIPSGGVPGRVQFGFNDDFNDEDEENEEDAILSTPFRRVNGMRQGEQVVELEPKSTSLVANSLLLSEHSDRSLLSLSNADDIVNDLVPRRTVLLPLSAAASASLMETNMCNGGPSDLMLSDLKGRQLNSGCKYKDRTRHQPPRKTNSRSTIRGYLTSETDSHDRRITRSEAQKPKGYITRSKVIKVAS